MSMPTQDEILATFAAQEAECRRRVLAGAVTPPRDHTDAAVELRAVGLKPVEQQTPAGGWTTEIVDVMREKLPPRTDATVVRTDPPPAYFCGDCGKVFSVAQWKTEGMAKMQRTKHRKRAHPVV